jgi:RNA polymerase sigma-70 factor, ECF subfamily
MVVASLVDVVYDSSIRRWQGCTLSRQVFASFIMERAVATDSLKRFGEELFLAKACGEGDPTAIRYLEDQYLHRAEDFASRFRLSPEELSEHRQSLRVRLLVGPRPGILRYRGYGPLAAWLRVVSIRLASDRVADRSSMDRWAEPGLYDRLVVDALSPDLEAAKLEHRDLFMTALEASLAALGAREKTLLRMHLLDDLNLDAIGLVYRVHRSTVARWLVSIREQLLASLRLSLSLKLPVTKSEIRSLARALWGEVQVSLDRILDAPNTAPPADGQRV